EPPLAQRWQELGGAVVGQERPADIAQRLQGDSHAEICVGVARAACDGALKCADRVRCAADLEKGEAEVVLDDGVGRLQERRVTQRSNSIGWSPILQE